MRYEDNVVGHTIGSRSLHAITGADTVPGSMSVMRITMVPLISKPGSPQKKRADEKSQSVMMQSGFSFSV